MPNTTTSPNMHLPVPTVGVDPGPDWATNYNACMSAIDSHNHTSGQGVPITPDGLNINADFPMNNSNVTTIKTLRFTPQTSINAGVSDIGCLQEVGIDLYYIDGSGNQIRITQSGSVAGSTGTITGLPSGTASAAFAGTTFTFQSSTNTPASFDLGPVKIGQAVASGFGVTVSAATAQASNYGLSLPAALPASTKIMTVDSSGNIGDTLYVDNSTLEVSSNSIQIKASGVDTVQLNNGAVTVSKLSASVNDSTGTGTYTNASGAFTTIASVTIVAAANRPVLIQLYPDSTSSSSEARIQVAASTDVAFLLLKNGVDTFMTQLSTNTTSQIFPPGIISFTDIPTPGSVTYALRAKINAGVSVDIRRCRLFIYEI